MHFADAGYPVLKSDIEIGPEYHRLPQSSRAHALVCFVALIPHRGMRMRLKAEAATRASSPSPAQAPSSGGRWPGERP